MLFSKKTKPGDYEVIKEGNEEIMWMNYNNYSFSPSIEDSDICMSKTIEYLIQNPSVHKIVFSQYGKNYEYSFDNTSMLIEIANIHNYFLKQKKILSLGAMGTSLECTTCLPERLSQVQYIILNLLRSDPIGAYVELKRLVREETILQGKTTIPKCSECRQHYINLLSLVKNFLDQTKLIAMAKPYIDGYQIGTREVYRKIFRAVITPDFMYTRLMADPPLNGEEIDAYSIDAKTNVTIFRTPGDIKLLYHLEPPEFKISEDKYMLLTLAKSVLSEHKPKAEEFVDPERIRRTFFNIGKDLLTELATHRGIEISYNEIEELADILVRYTVGFGLIEILLNDKKVQDISINGPIGQTPIFLVHADYDECVTNIYPSLDDGEGWATKFRLLSGRPLDEANPVLDTELTLPNSRNRVAIITRPLNPSGLAFSLRRHRDKPWTLPLYIENRMLSPLAAGLISFLIDGARTMIVAGTRGSGKTSFLDSCLLEIMRKFRIITVEDTFELSTDKLRDLGYNIQPMKVRAALMGKSSEIAADEGIRTSLRMGDSSLIVGEIRSTEALALYEAMRVGALANVVAGTIHGDSPYGVFDRVVNDLKVPRTSFKATDIIVICNPIRSPDGMHKWRRITQITEVRKEWEEDPLKENGFVDLMKYDSKTDSLQPTDALINGESDVIKSIAGNIKEWAGNWDAVWNNILLRAKLKETLVKYSKMTNMPELLESETVVLFNDIFHKVSGDVKTETGKLDNKKIFFRWEDELKKYIKQKTFEKSRI
ncbi:MAG: type II/IV secretion system ATPase subunit [Candidatus Nanoarchaeia archaeon]|nr:type II/IV secretion system ATPase subunit [Candidatus Nanoarchaeia archaeon]MDD5587892.1 type II/IV secretion system ATPase subunit [Candidatus Nanoarchaeia archaeon]